MSVEDPEHYFLFNKHINTIVGLWIQVMCI